HLPSMDSTDLFGREEQLNRIGEAWDSGRNAIVCLVAPGGVGKSAITRRWLSAMHDGHYPGAERVYAWSFYRQGTTDNRVSSDDFITHATQWFEDPEPDVAAPYA